MILSHSVQADQLELEQAWRLEPDSRPYLTSYWGLQQGMAYNPVTGHLLLVDRADYVLNYGPVGVHIIDSNDGSDLGVMDSSMTELNGTSQRPLHLIAVAPDGVIFSANLAGPGLGGFSVNIYRWQDENSPQTLAFSGDPLPGVQTWWGATLSVRGIGSATEVLMCSSGGRHAVLFRAGVDGQISPQAIDLDPPIFRATDIHGLAFDGPDAFWACSGPLSRYSIDRENLQAHGTRQFENLPSMNALTSVGLQLDRKLLAVLGLHYSNVFRVNLFDASNPQVKPVLLDSEPFPFTTNNPAYTGSVQFSTNRLFVLNTDNGIVAYDLKSVPETAPVILAQPIDEVPHQGAAGFEVLAKGALPRSYQWFHNNAPIPGAIDSYLRLTNIQESAIGRYKVVVTNPHGSATSRSATLSLSDLGIPMPPDLIVSHLGNRVSLSWAAPSQEFILESSLKLGSDASWSSFGTTPSAQGDDLSVTLDATVPSRYFRLRKS